MERILDPRTKLIGLILAAIYISLQLSFINELVMIFIFILPFFLGRLFKTGFIFIGLYTLQLLGSFYLLPKIHMPFLIFIFSFLTFGLRKLLPSILIGVYSMQTTNVNEWIAAFKKMKMPNTLLIPLAVMARFFPTIKEDYQSIRKAMAFRGIGTNFGDIFKHPLQTFEYILIPLLMNATQVAEDLTVSSLTKGLSLSEKHTSVIQLKMSIYDWSYLIMTLLPIYLHIRGVSG